MLLECVLSTKRVDSVTKSSSFPKRNLKRTSWHETPSYWNSRDLQIASEKLYLLHDSFRPKARARWLTAPSFSFCMHLRFRLKDPIATPTFGGLRVGPAGFADVAHRWLAGARMGWVMTRSREVFALENQLWLRGWAARPCTAASVRSPRRAPLASRVSEHFIRLKSNFSWEVWFIYLYLSFINFNLDKVENINWIISR